jgi:Trk K+ transport system NAD-binding subunit
MDDAPPNPAEADANGTPPTPADALQVPALGYRHVIIAGFGIVGRMVAEQLEEAGASVTVIDLNPKTITQQRRLQRTTIHGDVCDIACLREAGIERADALIVAVPDEDQAIRACHVARQLQPKLFIAARANFVSRGLMAAQAGADCVVVEEVVTAQAMQQAVMKRLLGQGDASETDGLVGLPRPDRTGKPPR